MTAIDIENMNLNDLKELRARIDHRTKTIITANIDEMRQRLTDEMAEFGLTFDDVMGGQRKKRGRKPKIPQPETMAET